MGSGDRQMGTLQSLGSRALTSYVDDFAALYWLCSQHAMLKRLQWLEGTHRLELPVSNITLKVWGGVPKPISP